MEKGADGLAVGAPGIPERMSEMDYVLYYFFQIIELIIHTGSFIWFLYSMPRETESKPWVRYCAWGIFMVLTFLLPALWWNDIITMSVLTVYYIAVCWLFYHRSRTWILYSLIYGMANYGAQVIGIYFTVYISKKFGFYQEMLSYYTLVLAKTICLFSVTYLMRRIVRKRMVKDQTELHIRGMILVPLFSMILVYLYCVSGESFFLEHGFWGVILCMILLMVINIYCLYVWYDLAENRELKHKVELMKQQNELTHQYYADMENNYNRSRRIIHDIRNHLNMLEQSVKTNNTDYFEDVHGMLNSLGLKFYSDNRMLNMILNDKLKKLEPGQAECNMGGVSLDFLTDMDVTTIFANLLDNAIEAGENKKNFWIKIRGEQIQDFTIVRIWNPSSEMYAPGHSGKQGHEGIGLENVRHTVEKYHGALNIETKDGIFSVTAVFPGE